MNLPELSKFLAIVYVFILLILRACYFIFVSKDDPIKAITSITPKWLQKKIEHRNASRKAAHLS